MSRNRNLHVSWLIFWVCIGLLAGVACSPLAKGYFAEGWWAVIGLSILFIALIDRTKKIIILVVIAGLILGLSRGSAVQLSEQTYSTYFGQRVTLEGTVADDTSLSVSGEQRIKLKNIKIQGSPASGSVWISTKDTAQIKRSNLLIVDGQLSQGFGSYAATMFRADIQKIIDIRHKDVAREVRDWFASGIKAVIPEPESSLGIGFLTGQHTSLPQDLENNLKLLGLTHIVVASGYNLTILVRFARRLFAKISKYLATLVTSSLVAGFVLVTGFSPSMSRAALITCLSLAAWYYGRRIHPLILLAFAAALTAVINPAYLWGDIGWYLSFMAFGGVIVVSPLLLHYFWGLKNKINPLHQVFLETLSAQIMTAPIIAYVFSQYSALALPANLLILLLIPLTMLLTFIAGALSLAFGPLAVFGWPAYGLLSYMTTVVDKLAVLPLALAEVNFGFPALIASYCAILAIIVYLWAYPA